MRWVRFRPHVHVVTVDTRYLPRIVLVGVGAVILGSRPIVACPDASVNPSNTLFRRPVSLGPVRALSNTNSRVYSLKAE
jgi:hypothetical protein